MEKIINNMSTLYHCLKSCKEQLYYFKYFSACSETRNSPHFFVLMEINLKMLCINMSVILNFSKNEHYSLWALFRRMEDKSNATKAPYGMVQKSRNLLLAQKHVIDRVLEIRNKGIAHIDKNGCQLFSKLSLRQTEELVKVIELIYLDFYNHIFEADFKNVPIVFDKYNESLAEALSMQ